MEKEGSLRKKLDFKKLSDFGDYGISDRRFRRHSFFEDMSKELWEKIAITNQGKHMTSFYDLYMIRTLVSPFLLHIKREFTKKIKSIKEYKKELKAGNKHAKETYRIKLRSYLSHDTFLTPIMFILGIIDPRCVYNESTTLNSKKCMSKPPVASAFVWELNEKEEDGKTKFYVNATFKGKYFNICNLDSKDTDKDFSCPFKTF